MAEQQTVPPPGGSPNLLSAPTATSEAVVHAIMGAQFGDLEFDVGKSVRWAQWFSDDVFVADINIGETRYWVVNWTLTYPEVFNAITRVNYFADSVAFRKDCFRLADQHLILDPSDWVLFVDAHEGLSCDTRSEPDDVLIQPFRSYVYREVARATTAGRDRVVIPWYAFLRETDVMNVD